MAGTIPLNELEEAAFLAALARESPPIRCLCTLALHTGLRASSLLAQTVGKVWTGTEVRPILHVERRQLKGGKGKRKRSVSGRSIPLNVAAKAAITDAMLDRQRFAPVHQDAPLFPGHDGKPMSIWAYNRVLRRIMRVAGIAESGRSSHALRKTFCHHCYELSGYDLVTTRSLMGHRHLSTLAAYLAPDEEKAADVLHQLGEPRGGKTMRVLTSNGGIA